MRGGWEEGKEYDERGRRKGRERRRGKKKGGAGRDGVRGWRKDTTARREGRRER